MWKGLIDSLYEMQKLIGIDKAKHLSFEMSVWNIDGKVVSFLASREGGVLRVFDRREMDLSASGGRLPKSFFDAEVKSLEYDYRRSDLIGSVTDDDEKTEWSDELLDLYGFSGVNHNLIYSTDMKSVKESHYYHYRECFPADWEDPFEEKDYYFVISNDVGLRGLDENGKDFPYENGYWKVRALSFLDAHRFYEHVICKNFDYDKEYAWEVGALSLDCNTVFRGATKEELANDPNAKKQFEEYKSKYLTGRKCFGEFSAEEWMDRNKAQNGDRTIEYYDAHADAFAGDTGDVDFREVQERFLSRLLPGAKILDFGCGAGRDAGYFASRGFDVTAVDGSEKLCKVASMRTGLNVRKMLFSELYEVERYDGIWACASVLHLRKEELRDVFAKMTRAVKTKGFIYLSFKYGDFEGYRGERYFTDFSEEGFDEFLTGFSELRLVEEWVSADVRPGRNDEKWLNVILQKEKADNVKSIPVVAAIIKSRNSLGEPVFLATQRGYGAYKDGWEFPGGKMEANETPQEALVREIREELNMEITVGEELLTVEYDYPEFHLSMKCFVCTIASGEPELLEHEAARWLTYEELDNVGWLAADVYVVNKLKEGRP